MLVWKNSTSPAATFSTGSPDGEGGGVRSEEHTSELQSLRHLVCRLLLEKKKNIWRKGRPSQHGEAGNSPVCEEPPVHHSISTPDLQKPVPALLSSLPLG